MKQPRKIASACVALLLAYASPCTAGDNTVGGPAAGADLTTGTNNTILGTLAGESVTTGTDNTLVGYKGGKSVTGNYNVMLGEDPSSAITSGSSNILVGNSLTGLTATSSNQLNIGNVITGTGLGTPSTSTITIPGNLTVTGTCTGCGGGGSGTVNSGTQYDLGYYATTGTAISGDSSIVTDSSGDLSLSSGSYQLDADTVLAFPGGDTTSIAVGKSALAAGGGEGGNSALGNLALTDITYGYWNAAVGQYALEYSTTGFVNTAVGVLAMQGTSASPLVGALNTAVGFLALAQLEGEASDNTGIGEGAGVSITTGTDNTLIGYSAGVDVTGNFNVMLGEDPDGAITTGSSNILIGNGLTGLTVTSNYQLNIGNVITGTGLGTPSSSTVTIQGNLVVNGGLSAATAIFSSGQLLCGGSNCNNSTGSTTLSYCPYKGNLKTTAEYDTYTIPSGTAASGCLTATLTDMYIGGSAGHSATDSTLYYVYLINVSGTTYLDLETTGHATDSTTGIEVEDGNSANTLVGMIYTNSSGKIFTGGETYWSSDTNTVATWDNRQPTTTRCAVTGSDVTISSSTPELLSDTDTCSFMSWGDAAQFSSQQVGCETSTLQLVTTGIWLDGDSSTVASNLAIYPYYEGYSDCGYETLIVAPSAYTPTEGYHYAQLYGEVTSGSVIYLAGQPTLVFTIQ